MSSSHVVKVVTDRLEAHWAPLVDGTLILLQWEQIDDPAQAGGAAFAAVQFPNAIDDQAEYCDSYSGMYAEVGSALVHIFTPIGDDLTQARDWSKAAAQLFQFQDIDDVHFDPPGHSMTAGSSGDGNYNPSVYATLPYEYRRKEQKVFV